MIGKPVFTLGKMTVAQRLLKRHLKELGVKTIAEYRFHEERRWRFDLASEELKIGFECDGQFKGGHMRWKSLAKDYEKQNTAQALGWKVIRFMNEQILDGSAKAWIAKNLLNREG